MIALSFLLSTLFGIVLTIILEALIGKSIAAVVVRFVRRVRLSFTRSRAPLSVPESFRLGATTLPFLVVDGDGSLAYSREALEAVLGPPPSLPTEVTALRNEIDRREGAKRAEGRTAQWNGPLLSLSRYAIGRTVPEENPTLTLTLAPSDYYTFQATVMSLDAKLSDLSGATLRQRYLSGADLSLPIEFLAQGFGVSLVALSSDEHVLLSWRSPSSGARPGELDVTVVEGVHPVLDRGLGLIRVDVPASDLLERRSRGTGGKWELRRIEPFPANPEALFGFLRQHRMWAIGWVTLFWSLSHVYGRGVVERAAEKVFGSAGGR